MENGCLWLTILGGCFEITGLGLVAWEITRIQREEFGTPRWMRRIEKRWRVLWLRLRGRSGGMALPLSVSRGRARATGDITVSSQQSPLEPTLEERVTVLEETTKRMERGAEERSERLGSRIDKAERRIGEVQAVLKREQEARERRRQESLRTAITVQSIGTVLFTIGVFLAVLGTALHLLAGCALTPRGRGGVWPPPRSPRTTGSRLRGRARRPFCKTNGQPVPHFLLGRRGGGRTPPGCPLDQM
jgi:hypothetical protein